jgi:hypothetical protein
LKFCIDSSDERREWRENSEKIGTGLLFNGGEEGLEDDDAGFGEAAGGVEPNLAREVVEIAAQRGDGISEAREAGIAAHLADGAQDANGAQLLENIGIAKNGGFRRGGLILGLVLAHDLKDGGNFRFGEAGVAQDLRRVGAGIGNVIPPGEFLGTFGAIANENAQVVKPGGSHNDLVVVVQAGADRFDECLKAGLVSKFIDRPGLLPNQVPKTIEGTRVHVTFVPRSGLFSRGSAEVAQNYAAVISGQDSGIDTAAMAI